jgi:hypothetical protein
MSGLEASSEPQVPGLDNDLGAALIQTDDGIAALTSTTTAPAAAAAGADAPKCTMYNLARGMMATDRDLDAVKAQ